MVQVGIDGIVFFGSYVCCVCVELLLEFFYMGQCGWGCGGVWGEDVQFVLQQIGVG